MKPQSQHSYLRFALIDQLRGIGFIMMAFFHFCYDLSYFNIFYVPLFTHPFWIGFRMIILLLFLGMMGTGLYIHVNRGFSKRKYSIRLAKITGSALLITLATAIALPDYFVFFGILHMIAVSSILALLFLFLPEKYHSFYAILGVLLLILGNLYPLNLPVEWVWLWNAKLVPSTVDYAPLIPNFGFVLIGISFGKHAEKWAHYKLKGITAQIFEWCGKNALWLYLVHQPILWVGFIFYVIIRR